MLQKKNIALLAVSTALGLLLGELLLRAVSPAETAPNHHQLYCEHDPLLGWRKRPNTNGHHRTSEYDVVEQINAQGLRGPDLPFAKALGTTRILFLGDSFTEGYTVAKDSHFIGIMQKALAAKCPDARFEAINGGTGGYSTDQELLFFEKYGLQYDPDAVVLMFCTNDPWFNRQSRYYDRGFKPMFVPVADSLQLTNVPVPHMASRSFFTKMKDGLLKNSRLVQRLRNVRDMVSNKNRGIPEEWRIYQKTGGIEMDEAWRVTEMLLWRLKKKASGVGINLSVCYIPEKIEVHDGAWKDFIGTYPRAAETCDLGLPSRKLGEICSRLQVPFLNPTGEFRARALADSNAWFYFQHDWHWNAAGNRVAGELLAKHFFCPE